MSKGPLSTKGTPSSQKKTFSQTKTPSQKTRRRKDPFLVTPKHSLPNSMKNNQIPMTYTTLQIPPKDP